MSLRIKTLIITGVLVLGILVVMYMLSQTVLLTTFEELEAREMRQNAERLKTALDDNLAILGSNNQDYARWDESYAFVEDLNAEFRDVELSDEIVANLNINLLVYTDTSGKIVFTKAVDIQNAVSVPPPASLDDYLPSSSPLFNQAEGEEGVTGMLDLPEGIMLISSRPVVDSLATQPSRGFLLMGRFLDDNELATLSSGLRLPISLRRAADQMEADFAEAAASLTADSPIFTRPLDSSTIAAYISLSDLNGKAVAILRADQSRDTYTQGQSTISSFFLLLLIGGALFLAVSLLSIERFFLSPLSRLTKNVNRIASSGDPAERLTVTGNDELAWLGNDINRMLGQLEQSQVALHEQDVRLRTVVKSSPIMLWAVDREERFTLAEGRGLSSLGIDPQSATGKKATEVFINVPHLLDEIRRAAKGESFGSLTPIGEHTFDMRYTPIRNAEGDISGVIGVATDVTERVKAEQKLTTTYNDLSIQNRRLQRVSELLRSTVSVMTETVKRGAPRDELLDYMTFVSSEMSELN